VLVNMEIFGINPHIRDVTERTAREGYAALAFDYFHRTGPGAEYGYDDAGFARGMKLLGALRASEMISDSRAALAWLRGREDVRADRIGAIGFCIGGHMTYLQACTLDLRAAASFYGGGIAAPSGPGGEESTIGRTRGITGRILCLFGGKDAFIPNEQVHAIRRALDQAGVRHDVVVYPQADHGFFCDERGSYRKEDAADAWEHVKRLFAEELRD
jgi:carboxymethylenebutenolidase